MLANLTGWHLLVVLAIVLLIFGATRLPALAKGLGESMRVFRTEVAPEKAGDASVAESETSVAAPR